MHSSEPKISFGRFASLTLLAWLSMIGFDFFLHAGLLARLYMEPSPFLLSSAQAFSLIPVGYLSFLVLAILLIWLMGKLEICGWRPGLIFGFKLGALAWSAFTLGLLSISTAAATLLLGWYLGQTIEMAIAGMFAGSALAGAKLGGLFLKVTLLLIGAFVITVILQSIGLAPTVRR